MEHVEQEIFAVDIVDVAVIACKPNRPATHRPAGKSNRRKGSPGHLPRSWSLHPERMHCGQTGRGTCRPECARSCWLDARVLRSGPLLGRFGSLVVRLHLFALLYLLLVSGSCLSSFGGFASSCLGGFISSCRAAGPAFILPFRFFLPLRLLLPWFLFLCFSSCA